MRILQVINSMDTGGAEKLLLDSIPKYRTLGVEMDLLVLNGADYPFLDKLRTVSDCKIHSLGKGSLYNPFHVFRILKYFKMYDIVHGHLFPTLYWLAFARMISFSKPILFFTEHNTTNSRRNKPLIKWLERMVYGQFKVIITISNQVDLLLKKHLDFSSHRFVLIPNGIDITKIQEARPADRKDFVHAEDDKILLQVASFTEQKDQPTLIRSIVHIISPLQLLLVGTGPLLEANKELTRDLNINDRVKFLGIRMDVPRLLKMADVVVLSSHFEGLSLSSIEGMASGKPFVASQVPGLTDVVDGAGILFPEGDAKALADCLNELLEDPDHYERTAARCTDRASQYDIDKLIQKHLNLYREVWKNQS